MAAEGGVQLGPKTRSFCILIKYSTWSDSDTCYYSSSLFRTAKVMVGRKANCCPFISKSSKRSINAFCDITRMYESMCFTANFLKSGASFRREGLT